MDVNLYWPCILLYSVMVAIMTFIYCRFAICVAFDHLGHKCICVFIIVQCLLIM